MAVGPVFVDRWEWEDTNGGEITLRGYDDAGAVVARRTFEHVETEVCIGGDWIPASSNADGSPVLWSRETGLQPTERGTNGGER